MTETFTIGRSGAPSPFRDELMSEAEAFVAPQEPEYSLPGEDSASRDEALLDEGYATGAEEALSEQEDEQPSRPAVQGQSAIAVQAARQWDSVDRPAGWIGKVYGLVVHTTGGGLPSKAKSRGIYHTAFAVNYYSQSHGCHYVNGWRGVGGGDLLQVANEREQANGVGVGDQRRSIDQGRFEKDLPAAVVAQWRSRWPGVEHPLKLLPGTRTANSCYVHVECVPCVFHHGKQLVTDATPLRAGLRFTQEQHEAVALLACDIARRNGWPLQSTWWRSARLVGHEDLTPYNRHDRAGGWDPGGMRAAPYFDWDFVHSMIERECRTARTVTRPSWWPFSEGEALDDERQGDSATELEDEPEAEREAEPGLTEEWEDEQDRLDTAWEDVEETEEAEEAEEAEDELEDAYGNELEGELEDESSFLEPFRLAMAIARGQREEKALTNGVFFARHPELGGRAIAPGERDLASEWVRIRDTLVRPLLARASQPSSGATGSGGALPAGPFGTLVLNAPGRRAGRGASFTYPFTAEDALWTAKLIQMEVGAGSADDKAAVIWTMFNKFALHRKEPTFASFLRKYSTTLQPVLASWQAAQRHQHNPDFVPSGGTYSDPKAPPGILRGQLGRHTRVQALPWSGLEGWARTMALDALRGSIANPGIGLATEFASTRILWKQAHRTKTEPSEQDWIAFTRDLPRRKNEAWTWIGPSPTIDQRRHNAFFIRQSDASLRPDAVTVTP